MVEKGRGLVYNKARLNPDRSGRGANSLAKENDHATRTISIVMVITLIGKVLGLYRDHLMAVHYGTARDGGQGLLCGQPDSESLF